MSRLCIVAVALLTAAARPSEACSKRHQSLFELTDLAETVAYVKVTSASKAEAELVPTKVLKGDSKRKKLVVHETNTSCHIGYTTGRTALVFLGANGWATGGYEGYRTDLAALGDLVDRYAAASDDAARFAVVLDAITGDVKDASFEAAYYLVDHPELLARVDRDAHARLLELAKHPPHGGIRGGIEDDGLFVAVLARLRDPEAKALLHADRRRWARAPEDMLAIDKFEAIDDPAKLADAVETTSGAEQIAAFERCERVRGIPLYPFTGYIHGVAPTYWKTLAGACRTGKHV